MTGLRAPQHHVMTNTMTKTPMPSQKPIPPKADAAIREIVGEKGIIAAADAAPYLEEWRGKWRGQTNLIVAPATTKDVADIVKICAEHRVAITPQGGNTGLVGGQMPTEGELLLSLKRLNRIRDISPLDGAMIVEAGVTLAAAQNAALDVDRFFPLSIGSEGTCQIGGVISTNAGGVNVLRYGNMRDLVLGIEAVTPSGEIWQGLKRLRKDNTGYDLKQVFIGAEGTLGIVTAASVKLFPLAKETSTVFAALPDPGAAVRLLSRAQTASGNQTTSFELIGRYGLDLVLKNISGARDPLAATAPWYALIEFSAGTPETLPTMVETFLAEALAAGEITDATIAANAKQAQALWHIRHAMSEAMKPEGLPQAKHDVSTPLSRVPEFLDKADAAIEKIAPGARIVAFGHMGDGNIHYDVLPPDPVRGAGFADKIHAIEQAVYDVIDSCEGSISAEHGIGLARRDDLIARETGPALDMMRAMKSALDPLGIMNPGKMI